MSSRKERITVALGPDDGFYDRIEIRYPKTSPYLSLNPIREILQKNDFYVAQIIDFYLPGKRVVLLIRNREDDGANA